MKLTRFRVQNYKKINDTGWVGVGQMTAFVGKNEAGKSAVFRGLSKLNPSDGAKYDALKEFPRRRYTREPKRAAQPVSSAAFKLSESELAGLTKISTAFENTTHVVATRHYNDILEIKYEPDVPQYILDRADYEATLDRWQNEILSMTSSEDEEKVGEFKTALVDAINDARGVVQGTDQIRREHLKTLQTQLGAVTTTPWQKELAAELTSNAGNLESQFQVNEDLVKASSFVRDHLPKFIYFDHYYVLDSAVRIDEFIRKLNDNPDEPKLRVTKCLFEQVGLDINKVQELDPANPEIKDDKLWERADERATMVFAAADDMTAKFSNWWEQRKHRFHYGIDGRHFRVWVSDDLDPSKIELDQRSAGMQYFFSFFLVFLNELDDRHANSILLLDEPGLQFHGTAQQKTVEFLRKLSGDNQLLYTTHSPFMVDADHLEDVRIVTEDEDDFGTTKVSDDVWPSDPDALFPLQAGLGYSMAQSLFYSNRQVIVEGITDYMYLKAASGYLAKSSGRHLDRGIAILPAGGTKNMMRLAPLLLGNDIRTVTVLDGDEAGLQASKKLKEIAPDIVILDEFAGKEKSEIEDMFDETFFMGAVKSAYPEVELDFNSEEKQIGGVARRASALFARKGKKFNKYGVCTAILAMLADNGNTSVPSGACLAKFERLFERLNELCSPPAARGAAAPAGSR